MRKDARSPALIGRQVWHRNIIPVSQRQYRSALKCRSAVAISPAHAWGAPIHDCLVWPYLSVVLLGLASVRKTCDFFVWCTYEDVPVSSGHCYPHTGHSVTNQGSALMVLYPPVTQGARGINGVTMLRKYRSLLTRHGNLDNGIHQAHSSFP